MPMSYLLNPSQKHPLPDCNTSPLNQQFQLWHPLLALQLISDQETIEILDTKKENNVILHYCDVLPEHTGSEFKAQVDVEKRSATACNHSGTHLLHQALRSVLGDHVEQKGSSVNSEHLRFDFSHFEKVSKEEIDFITEKQRQTFMHYKERFVDYICQNSTLFPEYNANTNGDMYPNSDTNFTGWVL